MSRRGRNRRSYYSERLGTEGTPYERWGRFDWLDEQLNRPEPPRVAGTGCKTCSTVRDWARRLFAPAEPEAVEKMRAQVGDFATGSLKTTPKLVSVAAKEGYEATGLPKPGFVLSTVALWAGAAVAGYLYLVKGVK